VVERSGAEAAVELRGELRTICRELVAPGVVDLDEMAAPQVAVGPAGGQQRRRRPGVAGVLVVHHRALALRIGEQSGRDPQLKHVGGRGSPALGLAQRVPRAKPHRAMVAADLGAQEVLMGRAELMIWCPRIRCPWMSAMIDPPIASVSTPPSGWFVGETVPGAAPRPANVLAVGDSLDLAEAWPPASLACVYMDPPFGTGVVRRGRGHDYRDVDDDPGEFVQWLTPWLAASLRCLTVTGSLFVHLDYRTVHYVKVALDQLFGRDRMVNELIWCYAVGGKSRRGFGRKHDTILWYSRGPEWAFYPEAVRIARRGGSHMRVVRDEEGRAVQEKTDRKTGRVYRYPVAAGKIPEDWWTDIETLNHSDRERTGWPSQKPERLIERIVQATTVAGDRVADWFAGSATLAAVAQRLDRGFVVADREPGAIALARQRLRRQTGELAVGGQQVPPLEVWTREPSLPGVDPAA
jgi:DNA modification methylase